MTDKVENCGNCVFGQDEFRNFNYKCRRHSPITVPTEFGYSTIWPRVNMSDFCGDFELKDAK